MQQLTSSAPAPGGPGEPDGEFRLSSAAAVLWRRRWIALAVLLACLAAALFWTQRAPRRWRAEAQMALIQREPSAPRAGQGEYAAPLVETVETQVGMLQSEAMAQHTLDWLTEDARRHARPAPRLTREELQRAMTVSNPRDTNLLNVSVAGSSRDEAREIAGAVCLAFLRWKREMARQDIQQTEQSLQMRAQRARGEMIAAENRVTQFKKRHSLVDIPAQEKATLEQYLARQTEVAALDSEVTSQKTRLAALGAQLNAANAAIKSGTGVRDDAQVLALQASLNALEIERANAKLKFTAKYPGVLSDLDGRIRNVKARLSQAVQGTLDNKKPSLQAQGALFDEYKQTQLAVLFAQARRAGAAAQRDRLAQKTQQLPQVGMDYARLSRNADLAAQLYTTLQGSLNAARLDQDMLGGSVQVTQPPIVPLAPFQPNVKMNLLLGGALGLFLALVVVLIVEQFDRRVHDVDDVRRLISAPVIGALPDLPAAQMKALAESHFEASVAEACNLTFANLTLFLHQAARRSLWLRGVILVTSAQPGEGVSTVAAQLARAFARTGKRTILVDANLRQTGPARPGDAPEILAAGVEPGLAEALAGQVSLPEAVQPSDMKHLSLVGSGQPTHNVVRLLASPLLGRTLEDLRAQADIVILDAPPCVGRADSLFLAPYADCVVQVVGLGRVDEEALVVTHDSLQAAGGKTALFLNRARSASAGAFRGVVSPLPDSPPPAPAPPPSLPAPAASPSRSKYRPAPARPAPIQPWGQDFEAMRTLKMERGPDGLRPIPEEDQT